MSLKHLGYGGIVMKKLFYRTAGVLLALTLLCTVFFAAPLTAFADEEPYFATGTCGSPNTEDVEYYLFDDGIKRNIRAFVGQESSKIFCGAVPFVVIGTFSGDKKSVTRASNGFASCVKIGGDVLLNLGDSLYRRH